ncbi:hypothetical protein AVEN_16773-1 [Araneus ventricosus]|uniref:Uncharacterized protein n=1 Tax=Araneus ventricosus TaxID=182803 RepID=A0A4Y2BSV0_ARAVE|nr:hypothetical protein AVEN_16773-1 [Araneus ventricosus]
MALAPLNPNQPTVHKNPDGSAVPSSKPSDSTSASPPITNLPIPSFPITNLPIPSFPITNLPILSSPSVAPVSEEALALPDVTDFKLVTNRKRLKKNSPTNTNNTITKAEKIAKFYTTSHRAVPNSIPSKDNISTQQSALKPFATTKPTSVDTELLPMAVLPPLEKILLQSRESDADAEMSSSSLSEDSIECNMSEDLEDSPAVISPPPSSKPGKANKYKNRLYAARPSHILPFCERAKMLLHDSDLNNVTIQSSDFFCFPPWDISHFFLFESLLGIRLFNNFFKTIAISILPSYPSLQKARNQMDMLVVV